MGIALSVIRCCLCLDDDDGPRGRADHRISNPYGRIAEPPSAGTHLYGRPRFEPTTALSTASERLLSTHQPAVATSVRISPLLAASASTSRAGDPAPRPRGSATSTTLPTLALSAPRLQQAHVESRAPSFSVVTGLAVGREVSVDSCSLSYEAWRRAVSVRTEVSGALPDVRTVVSPAPSSTPSSLASVSSSQLPRASEATRRSAHVQSSSVGQNPDLTATSATRRSQATLAGCSTSVEVGTRPVKREVTRDVPRAAVTHDLYGLSEKVMQETASAGAETCKTQASKYSPPKQSNRSQALVEKVARPKILESLETEKASPKAPIPVYEIPPHLKEMIKLDKVPCVLKKPLSASNYSEYFACLLYAEDFYLEKWSEYLLRGVNIEFHERSSKNTIRKDGVRYSKKSKDYVAFEIDSIPEKRPYILSRDFVFLQPLETNCQRIQGRVVRVQKNTTLLTEFEDDFWSQHSLGKRYNVSFSFNRVCLKRAHHAVVNALGPLLVSFLFPEKVHKATETMTQRLIYSRKLIIEQMNAINQITNLKGFPPYLIAGPPCIEKDASCSLSLTKTGHTICEAIIQIYRVCSNCRILICTPKNITCDTLLIELSGEITESQQFRANAAFRDYEDVPSNILPSCQFNDDDQCFTCPPLYELKAFKVVTSTYMSSFRLRRAGIKPGHFTHIFLVDACAVAEPEAVVPLANLASEDTAVVISGSESGFPWYVRSGMARRWGLKTSYFNRLLQRGLYKDDPSFVCRLSEDSNRARFNTLSY